MLTRARSTLGFEEPAPPAPEEVAQPEEGEVDEPEEVEPPPFSENLRALSKVEQWEFWHYGQACVILVERSRWWRRRGRFDWAGAELSLLRALKATAQRLMEGEFLSQSHGSEARKRVRFAPPARGGTTRTG